MHCFQDLLRQNGVAYGNLNFCAFNMRDPVSGKYYKKGTSLLRNFPPGTLDPIFKTCPNTTLKTIHEHETVEGHAKCHGSRTKLSQIYAYQFCEQLADVMGIHLGAKVLNVNSLLINDILEASLSDPELGSVHRHFSDTSYTESLAPCQATQSHQTTLSHGNLLSATLSPLPVKDYATKQLMATINSLAKGKELLLHLEGYDTITAKLTSLAQQARQKYLPVLSFSKCSVLRATFGATAPVGIGDESYLLFWRKNDSPKWIFLIQAQQHAELLHQFDPSEWSFLHFWKESGSHSGKRIEPPPGLQQKPQLDPTRPSQIPMDVAQAVPKLLLDDQVPGGHQLIPPQDDLMDHELEGEVLPPRDTKKPKNVKKAQTKEKHIEQEPKAKVKFYDDAPFEEEPAEEEPSGSRDRSRERSGAGPRERSRSPILESSDEELRPARPMVAPAAPADDGQSSDDQLVNYSEYQRGFKRRHAPDKDDEGWGDLIVFEESYLTDEHRFVSDTGSFQFCKDLDGKKS